MFRILVNRQVNRRLRYSVRTWFLSLGTEIYYCKAVGPGRQRNLA